MSLLWMTIFLIFLVTVVTYLNLYCLFLFSTLQHFLLLLYVAYLQRISWRLIDQ
uniref:Cell division cycle protein 48 homolog n=1 Tax=Rhizophora mucronata TaxID=61149 RepID=A0A2P2MIY8_RHIMU